MTLGPVDVLAATGFQTSMAFLPSLGFGELAILFVIVLILFGPGKLPEVCRALGDGLKQFKNAAKDVTSEPALPDKSAAAPPAIAASENR